MVVVLIGTRSCSVRTAVIVRHPNKIRPVIPSNYLLAHISNSKQADKHFAQCRKWTILSELKAMQ